MNFKQLFFRALDTFLKSIIIFFKPLIRYVANHADIRLNYHCEPNGQNPLILEDPSDKYNIPKSVYFNTRSGKIIIGKNTVFGEDVMILTGKHLSLSETTDSSPLHSVPESGRDIQIGKYCYIGSRAIVIGPVTIGDYAVVCAGAVVTKDIPPHTMVGGVPAKEIRKAHYE